jgi:hypothetical protein
MSERQASNTGGPVSAALLAFVRAYANADHLDADQSEVALFRAWLAAVGVLGVRAEVPPRAQTVMREHPELSELRFGPGGADDLRLEPRGEDA